MSRASRHPPLRAILLRAAGVAAAAGVIVVCQAFSPLDRGAEDTLLRIGASWPPSPPSDQPDVAVVAVDPHSLRAFPGWPWPRRIYARAIDRIDAAGARAIAFDIDFSSPSEAADDEELARAVAASGRVVLAAFRQTQALPGGAELEIANLPIEELTRASAAIGSVLVPTESDGVVRRAPFESRIAGRRTPSLARAALEIALGRATPRADASAPPRPASFPIDYRRARPAFPILSMTELLENRFDPHDLAGRVVFVGATAAEFQDLWTTPLGPARAGVLIQATALRTLAARAAGQPVARTLPAGGQFGLAALLSLLVAFLAGRAHTHRVAVLLAAALAMLAASLAGALLSGLLISPVLPLAVIAAHYALGAESVRKAFLLRLRASDSSLRALAGVAEATTQARGETRAEIDAIDHALSLLGHAVGARAVGLLRADRFGRLGSERIDWQSPETSNPADVSRRGVPSDRPGNRGLGDREFAERVLAETRPRILPANGNPTPGSVVYAPLEVAGDPIGVLVVECDGALDTQDGALRTITTAGAQIALCAQNSRLLEDLRQTFSSAMTAMAAAVEARDGYTDLHCRRLSSFSRLIAERMGLPSEEIEAIGLGALLHDVGKIGVRDAVLNKPGRFTPEERAEMMRHPLIGARVVGSVHGLSPTILHCVRHHHERWNGEGYPDGLSGEAIPLAARIVSVVDVWDALSSHRPYKRPLEQPRVLEMLAKMRGDLLDPGIVDLFLRVLEEEGAEMLALIEHDAESECA